MTQRYSNEFVMYNIHVVMASGYAHTNRHVLDSLRGNKSKSSTVCVASLNMNITYVQCQVA